MKTLTIDAAGLIAGDTNIMELENLATTLEVTIPSDMTGMSYKLKFRPYRSETILTTDPIVPVDGVVSYILPNTLTAVVGHLDVKLNGYNEAGALAKTAIYKLMVNDAIGGT